MSDMYDRVINVLNSESRKEQVELIHGPDGILDNSTEYYKSIATSFVKKKEEVLPKHGYSVTYDIEKDINDMIDILFIWKYIEKEWKDEQKEINKEKDTLKAERKKETDPIKKQELTDRINLLTNNSQEINKYIQKVNSRNVFIKDENKLFKSNELISEREELKKAINMIVKIRNSLSHRNKNLIIGEDLIIDTDIKVKIPIEYLEGFTKSQITPKEQDKQTFSEAATVAELIMKNIDKDPKKINSFFSSVDPVTLMALLNMYDNDINKIYELPIGVFYVNPNYLNTLIKFVKKEEIDNETLECILSDLNNEKIKTAIDTYNYLKNEKNINDKEFFKNLTRDDYFNKKRIDRIIELFESESIDYKYLKYVHPYKGFNINNFKEIILYIKNNNIDFNVLKYLKQEAYENSKNTIEILKHLKENNYDYNLLKYSFIKNEITPFFMFKKTHEKFERYKTNLYNNDSSISKRIIDYINNHNLSEEKTEILLNGRINNYDSFIKIVDYFENNNIDFKCLRILPKEISPESIINFYELLKNDGFTNSEMVDVSFLLGKIKNDSDLKYLYEIVKTFKQYGLNLFIYTMFNANNLKDTYKNLIETIKYLKEEKQLDSETTSRIIANNPNIVNNKKLLTFIISNNLSEDIIKSVSFDNLNKLQELLNLLKEKNIDLRIIKLLSVTSYNYPKQTVELLEFIRDNQIDIRVMHYLYYQSFENLSNTKALLKYFKDNNIHYSILGYLPMNSYNKINDIKGIINYMLKENISLELIKYFPNYDVSKFNSHRENIKFLSDKTGDNPEKINEYPNQFFTYDIKIINDALNLYSDNILKSIFGTNDYKMIASIIYANNVLTDNLLTNIDLDRKERKRIINLIVKNANDYTIEYFGERKKRKEISFKQYRDEMTKWTDGFICHKNNKNAFIENFIEKTRNASAHIRFKPSHVKGFIYMFDQDNDGNLNFSIDIKPEYLVEITHIVEESLNKAKTKDKGKTR